MTTTIRKLHNFSDLTLDRQTVETVNGINNHIAQLSDDTSSDTTGGKHVTNAQVKKYEDHRLITNANPHGTDHSQLDTIEGTGNRHITANENAEITAIDGITTGLVAKTADATYAGRTLTGTAAEVTVTNGNGVSGNPTITLPTVINGNHKFGDATNNIEIEANGFIKFNGTAAGYDDIQFNMAPQATGAGHPTLLAWNTDFEEWAYAVSDHANSESQEAPHWWKEGTDMHFHLHWTTGSGNYVSGDKVQWRLKISAADSKGVAPYTVFPAATVLDAEHVFAETVVPWSGIRTSFPTYTIPTTLTKIGGQIKIRLERIAKSAGGTDPGTPPFVLQIGAHAQMDTVASRSNGAK